MGRTHVVRATVLARGAVPLVAVLMATSMVTLASAHGGDTSLIHGCVTTATGGGASAANSGSVRIVGANETCRSGETALHWSQNGQGDVTAVVAGTGLSGGGSSGEVTLKVAVPLSLSESVSGPVITGNNTSGLGILGRGTSTGVSGSSESPGGIGVDGQATNNAGPSGIGVRGFSQQGDGVVGDAAGTSGAGIHGKGRNLAGLFEGFVTVDGGRLEIKQDSAFFEGILATNTNTSGYAGRFEGKTRINGTLEVDGALVVTGGCTGCATTSSDRNLKANFAAADSRLILERLVAIPIESWNYLSDDASVRHIGPMAQDFAAAFGVGPDDKHIDLVDANGVAIAAIQGLHQLVQEKDARLAALEQQNVTLERQNAALEARLAAIEDRLGVAPGN